MSDQSLNLPADRLGRHLREVRISLTDRCNFRCRYCMPAEVFGEAYAFLPTRELLDAGQIVRLVRAFKGLGVTKVRLTGGEPLLRRDLLEIVGDIARLGGLDLALTTNAFRLEALASDLKKAGLSRVNVSLDSLDEAVFQKMSGSRLTPAEVVRGIEAAEAAGLPLKVNCVAHRSWNATEWVPLAALCRERGWQLRFIEYMDVGNVNGWRPEDVVSGKELRTILAAAFGVALLPMGPLPEVARYWRYADTGLDVGFIESVSQPFCQGCTRARVSASGELLTCLFAETGTPLKPLLEASEDDAALVEAIRRVWIKRDDRYSEIRKDARQAGHRNEAEMWQVGG